MDLLHFSVLPVVMGISYYSDHFYIKQYGHQSLFAATACNCRSSLSAMHLLKKKIF